MRAMMKGERLREVSQDRGQGTRIEAVMVRRGLTMDSIARKIGASPVRLSQVIWGETKDPVIREGLAMVLGYRGWRELAASLDAENGRRAAV